MARKSDITNQVGSPTEKEQYREKAIAALAKMKALEKKKRKKLVFWQANDKTAIYATKERMEELKERLSTKEYYK